MLSLKSTVSILALTLVLSTQEAFSMDTTEDQLGSASSGPSSSQTNLPYKERKIFGTRPLTIIEDQYADSASHVYSKASVDNTETRRILSCVGGGVRGLFTAIEFAVFEEILNHDSNKDAQIKFRAKVQKENSEDYEKRKQQFGDNFPLYLRDVFDVGAGTSTGSILTAGLFGHWHFTAIDLAKIYTRYGYKIFDEKKHNVSGVTRAFYDRSGLDKILYDHFKNNAVKDVYKPIYIIANDETNKKELVFSSTPESNDLQELDKIYMRDAVGCSSSAPVFFDPVKLKTSSGEILVSDGGTIANNPSKHVYLLEKKKPNAAQSYEIYSFGTGDVPASAVRTASGAGSLLTLFIDNLTTQETLAFNHCKHEVEDQSSKLNYFAHINPKLEVGMGKLDATDSLYTNYMIRKALSVTKGKAFTEMMAHLGLNGPVNFDNIHESVIKQLNSLKSKDFDTLDEYEKEFVIKKILDLDFMFYQNRYYKDPVTGKTTQMSEQEAGIFLGKVKDHIVKLTTENNDWLNYMWSFVTTDKNANILEFIPRCMEFHGFSRQVKTLTANDFASLTTKAHFKLNNEELKYLSDPKTKTWTGNHNAENTLVCNLFGEFVKACENPAAKFTYPKLENNLLGLRTQPYIDIAALIFWKDVLRNIEGSVTKASLVQLKDNLLKNAEEHILANSYTRFGSYIRQSRYKILAQALDTYIKKFFNDEQSLSEATVVAPTTTHNSNNG